VEKITVQNLLEAGVHFGHQTYRWNPKMKPYVFGKRHGVTIFDLTITIRKLAEACTFLRQVTADGGKVLFVGTKRQCQGLMRQASEQTNMFHMTDRWLGGTLTNNKVIMSRVKRLQELRRMNEDGTFEQMPNKEEAQARRELSKLERTLGGIVGMNTLPDAMIVADIENDYIAVREANKCGIPVVAIVDSSCDPNNVDYVIPGNDDAVRSLKILINTLTASILEGRGELTKEEGEEPEQTEQAAATAEEANESAEKEAAEEDEETGSSGEEQETASVTSESSEESLVSEVDKTNPEKQEEKSE